jgi:heme/copper-type cytochrome/quinol oxidase subunit 3
MSDTAHGAHGHDDHGHGDANPFVQHHYDDAQHQFDSGKLGIWLFLAQEVLFFSALFVAYVLYRHHHPELYSYAHKYLDVKYGAINTAVLIFSSLTAAWAVRCAQLSQKRGLILCIALTIACACAFLVIKYIEYSHKVHEHILFGERFDPCVSSGEVPLLTKNNHCPGHKSSVRWNKATQRPFAGCYPELELDQDAKTPGAQVDCEVAEVTVKPSGKKDEKSGEDLWVDVRSTKIIKQCPDPFEEALAHAEGKEEHHDPGRYPCWRAAQQPAVCRIAWYFTQRCSAGTCKPSDKFEVGGPFLKESECKEERGKREGLINAQRAKEQKPQKDLEKQLKEGKDDEGRDFSAERKQELQAQIDSLKKTTVLTTAEFSNCQRSDAVGFIVEYGDHEHRGDDIQIRPSCKQSQKQVEPDLLAEKEQTLGVGPQTTKTERHYTTHELHALEAAGPPPDHTSMFFTIYFAMTGLHGIHVLAGVVVFLWLLIRAIKGQFTPDYFGPIDFAALYWHIVDLIWIFLFPLLYLIH